MRQNCNDLGPRKLLFITLEIFYMINKLIKLVQIQQVCPKALALIRTMIIDSRNSIVFSKVLTNLDLSSLTAILKNCCDNTPNNEAFIDNKASLTELTQLFFEMAKLPDLRLKILQTVSTEDIEKILSPLLKRDVSGSGDDWATNIFQVFSFILNKSLRWHENVYWLCCKTYRSLH